jgi:hypothetical protein
MNNKLVVLLRDFGYRYEGTTLINKGVPGYMSPKIVGTFSSLLSACDYLCPIVKAEEFSLRLMKYQNIAGN